ncbi:hypothetical protein WKK05_41255 (plasmid) [Nostoc sp. UHCC 0302]|uniref:hypothetical protein n=1 Tax=Nostoc sp. UHCC 0302 TaxID=3134896 RepID=UPI00311CBA0C
MIWQALELDCAIDFYFGAVTLSKWIADYVEAEGPLSLEKEFKTFNRAEHLVYEILLPKLTGKTREMLRHEAIVIVLPGDAFFSLIGLLFKFDETGNAVIACPKRYLSIWREWFRIDLVGYELGRTAKVNSDLLLEHQVVAKE